MRYTVASIVHEVWFPLTNIPFKGRALRVGAGCGGSTMVTCTVTSGVVSGGDGVTGIVVGVVGGDVDLTHPIATTKRITMAMVSI